MGKNDCIKNLDDKFIQWFQESNNRKNFVEKLDYINYKKEGDFAENFTSVKNNNCLYLPNKDLIILVKEILNQTNFASVDSYRKILEIRGGEYSIGTLYSSSRFAIELFNKKSIIQSLLEQCFSNNDDILKLINEKNNIKVHLEKLFYFTLIKPDGNKYNDKAHLDVCIEIYDKNKLKAILAIECKLKEIYSAHKTIFSSTFIKKFEDMKFQFKPGKNPKEVSLTEFKLESRFELKQQICHYFGLIEFKKNHKDVIVKFANFIFNPSLFNFNMDKEIIPAYNEWIDDSENISQEIIKKLNMNENENVDYCGSFCPNADLCCEKAKKVEAK